MQGTLRYFSSNISHLHFSKIGNPFSKRGFLFFYESCIQGILISKRRIHIGKWISVLKYFCAHCSFLHSMCFFHVFSFFLSVKVFFFKYHIVVTLCTFPSFGPLGSFLYSEDSCGNFKLHVVFHSILYIEMRCSHNRSFGPKHSLEPSNKALLENPCWIPSPHK